ncbi:MAG: type II toxin-antitoxin system Phd/YefM family antitoxin [Mariprofundaceae bacterium]|nr:type II toxin-antitoxin system Phd/YefM family antitoxin [Mariprofundaceae bacterium]
MNETIISLDQFSADSSRKIKVLQQSSSPLILTENGRATAVVEGYEHYQRQQKSLVLLRLMIQSENNIEHDRLMPQKQVFTSLKARLEEEKENNG